MLVNMFSNMTEIMHVKMVINVYYASLHCRYKAVNMHENMDTNMCADMAADMAADVTETCMLI